MEKAAWAARRETYTTPTKHRDDESENVIVNGNDMTTKNLRIMEVDEEMDSLSILPQQHHLKPRRPENLRSATEPTPALLLQGWFKERDSIHDSRADTNSIRQRRNRSPYSRSHLRSRSTGYSGLSAPLMARAHSLPNPSLQRSFDASMPSSGNLSPKSPLRGSISPRTRSPSKPEEALRSPSWAEAPSASAIGSGVGIESIQEDSELDITPRSSQAFHLQPSPVSSRSNSLRSSSAGSRRPPSPLHSLAHTTSAPTSCPAGIIDHHVPINTSASNSPALGPQKYNESYPHFHPSASTSSFSSSSFSLNFSHPSTPTSARSRSPSISSLETIEDAPEQEEQSEAEAEAAIAQLKVAAAQAESESDGEGDGVGNVRRRSLDAPRARRAGALGSDGGRKRWSICGGERRADLDLETIWED